MSLTRKHFKVIAEAIAEIQNEQDREKIKAFCISFCQGQNFRFDTGRFNDYIDKKIKERA